MWPLFFLFTRTSSWQAQARLAFKSEDEVLHFQVSSQELVELKPSPDCGSYYPMLQENHSPSPFTAAIFKTTRSLGHRRPF